MTNYGHAFARFQYAFFVSDFFVESQQIFTFYIICHEEILKRFCGIDMVIRQAIVTLKAAGVADTRITVVQSPATVNKFQFNMTVTSIATIDKLEIENSDIRLSAFIGTECRGTASLKYEDSCKRYMAFMMVWGNADDVNKIITFKSYDPISSKEKLATNSTHKFLPENTTGSPTTPYSIDFIDKPTQINPINESQIKLYPNPVTDDFKISGFTGLSSIAIMDLSGKILLVKQVAENETIPVSALPKGIYLIKMTTNRETTQRKFLKD